MEGAKDNIPPALRITISYVSETRLAPISSSDCRHQSPADAAAENMRLLRVCCFFMWMTLRAGALSTMETYPGLIKGWNDAVRVPPGKQEKQH